MWASAMVKQGSWRVAQAQDVSGGATHLEFSQKIRKGTDDNDSAGATLAIGGSEC